MLEFSKSILEKVSFDRGLFCKELSKAIKWVKPDEKTVLKVWCLAVFGHQYQNEILDVFRSVG